MASEPQRMEQSELEYIFNSLKPKQAISVWFNSAVRSADGWTELQVGRKSKSKKYNLEKISLTNPKNPKGSKYYLYNRQGRISFAMGDMGTSLIAIKTNGKNAESFNAEYPKSVSCAWCNREFNPNRDKHFEYNGEFMHYECAKEVFDVTAWEDVAVTPSAKAESFSLERVIPSPDRCYNHKTCGGYRVQGTFLCWPCHDIEADIRIAKRNEAESFAADEGKFVELLVEYNLPGDPEYIHDLLTDANMKIIEMKYVDVYGAESFSADDQTRHYKNLGIGAALVAGLAYWIKR